MTILTRGEAAPPFALADVPGALRSLDEERTHGLALLAFFSLECRACDLSYLFWDRMAEAYQDAGCPVLAISIDTSEAAADFYERSGVSFAILSDADRHLARAYGVECTPSLFLVGADSTILSSHDAFDRDALNALSWDIATRLGVPPVLLSDGEAPSFSPGCVIHLDG